MRNSDWQAEPDEWATEGFWASYSDLMAGVLMVFALLTVVASYQRQVVEDKMRQERLEAEKIRELFEEWKRVLTALSEDPAFRGEDAVTIDKETGAISVEMTEEFFDFGQDKLKKGGEALFRRIVPVYIERVKNNAVVWERVDKIEIRGHADRKAKDKDINLDISNRRAQNVLSFLLEDPAMAGFSDDLREKGVVAGYGHSQFPSPSVCPEERCDQARRVEIKVSLREEDVLRNVFKLLQLAFPETRDARIPTS